MKALSMMQPYPWLFMQGFLTVDDRSWSTLYRGPLAIHASKQFHEQYYDFIKRHTDIVLPEKDAFEQGGVVGYVDLVACMAPAALKGAPNGKPQMHRSHFGVSGFYGLVFANPRPIDMIVCRGNRNLFDISDRVLGLTK
jgi:hypothetical protein